MGAFHVFLLCVTGLSHLRVVSTSYVPWAPDWIQHREDLLCSTFCDQYKDQPPGVRAVEYFECCVCNSLTTWSGSEKNFQIEFVTSLGKTVVVSPHYYNESDVYKVEHHDSDMTEIPSNICDWDEEERMNETRMRIFKDFHLFWGKIVKISFVNNKIRHLPDLTCLNHLDILDMRQNRLTQISNSSLLNMKFLREVSFRDNNIITIEPGILMSEWVFVFNFHMDNNVIEILDVSNMMTFHPFCQITYDNNSIYKLSNDLDKTLDHTLSYGPGFVSIKDNNFKIWPDFKELLNLESLAELGKLIECGFSFLGAPLNCDCNVQDIVNQTADVLENLFLDYQVLKCDSPPELKGQNVYYVDQDKLTCELDDLSCPKGCACLDKPSHNTLYINCSNRKFTKLPESIPYSKNSEFIHLDVSENLIKFIPELPYLANVTVMNISGNNLEDLPSEIINELKDAYFIDISNNPSLHYLPQRIQFRSTCSIKMENLKIYCSCKNIWIEKWLSVKPCPKYKIFDCILEENKIIPATSLRRDLFNCNDDRTILLMIALLVGFLTVTLIVIATISFKFRFEILIIWIRLKQSLNNLPIVRTRFDVILSFDDENDSLRKWVNLTLVPYLEAKGYKLFLPYRDIPLGGVRDDVTISVLRHCRNFLLILSESYLQQDGRVWTENEWKYGWHMFVTDITKNIILVNYDHISSFSVSDPRIKAYLRVGRCIGFTNRNKDIEEHVAKLLGPVELYKPKLGLENFKTKYDVKNNVSNQDIDDFEQNMKIELETFKEVSESEEEPNTIYEYENDVNVEEEVLDTHYARKETKSPEIYDKSVITSLRCSSPDGNQFPPKNDNNLGSESVKESVHQRDNVSIVTNPLDKNEDFGWKLVSEKKRPDKGHFHYFHV